MGSRVRNVRTSVENAPVELTESAVRGLVARGLAALSSMLDGDDE